MRKAVTETGKTVVAGEHAQGVAICAQCGRPVSLRKRRRMGGGVTYFWRHIDNDNVPCCKRSGPSTWSS